MPEWQADFEIKQHLWQNSFFSNWKIYKPIRYRQITETESAEKHSEDQKHTSNVAKIYYQKIKLGNIAMNAKTCLEKLQVSCKSLEQLAAVNKATQSSNKIDFGKCEPSNQKLRQKKWLFRIARIILYAKGFLNMVMVVGLLY